MKNNDHPVLPSNGSALVMRGSKEFAAPETRYFKTKEEFDEAVGQDFIVHANRATKRGEAFLVGLSHGQSPSGGYTYILQHASEVKNWDHIRFMFVHSRLKSQRDLEGITDAGAFLKGLIRKGHITTEQVFATQLDREKMKEFVQRCNEKMAAYLEAHGKNGFDYVFLASDPTGRVAAITRKSAAFGSQEMSVVVHDRKEKELTATPHFLMQSKRIAFLATKADKRRALAWLYSPWGRKDESPSFLRHITDVKQRMTVFADNDALTWPQIKLERESLYGPSLIRIDTAKPYNPNAKKKLPVVLLIHGFLGLNSFDGLLTALPTHNYIGAAMHYGSIPNELPPELYSKHIVNNIDHVVNYFGSKGHPVYIFDHSMGNIYFLMMDRDFDKLEGIKKYLCGRIGANPFFGEESKHALIGFLDNVIIPSVSIAEKAMFTFFRGIIPIDSKKGVRKRGINLSEWLIREDSKRRNRIWQAIKGQILFLMSNMDSLPDLNRIPIERALNRLPAKVFAIQVHSALLESKAFDEQEGLVNMGKNNIPVRILKSKKDGVAKYVPRIYTGRNIQVTDVTNPFEKDLFREHLFHMTDPEGSARIISEFVTQAEEVRETVLE